MDPKSAPDLMAASVSSTPEGRRPLIVHNIGAGPALDDILFEYEITGHYRFRGLP